MRVIFLAIILSLIMSRSVANPDRKLDGQQEQFLTFLPNTVLVTVCNTGYIILTKNLIMSLERLNLGKYLIVASTEPEAVRLLTEMKEFSGRVLSLGNESSTEWAAWSNHSIFKARGSVSKLNVLSYFISRGLNVFWMDSDVAVLQDFREFFSPSDLHNYDLIIQDDASGLIYRAKSNPCTGFMFLRASPATLDFTNLDKHGSEFDQATGDQQYLRENFIEHWTYKLLPLTRFPNGRYLYNVVKTKEKLWTEYDRPYIVHMNWVIGRKKIQKHRQFGTMFYIQERGI